MHALQLVAAKVATAVPAAEIPKPDAPDFLKSSAIFGLVIFVAVMLTAIVGVKVLAKSDKQDNKKSLQVGGNVLIGWCIIVAAILGIVGAWLASALGFATTA